MPVRRQRAHEKIAEGGSGVGATTFPSTDHEVALGDEVGSAPEVEVRESRAELHHEIPHIVATATWRVQRILKQHIRCGEFVDDLGIPGIAPKPLKPAPHDGLVVLFA